jgi:hypothetical protein
MHARDATHSPTAPAVLLPSGSAPAPRASACTCTPSAGSRHAPLSSRQPSSARCAPHTLLAAAASATAGASASAASATAAYSLSGTCCAHARARTCARRAFAADGTAVVHDSCCQGCPALRTHTRTHAHTHAHAPAALPARTPRRPRHQLAAPARAAATRAAPGRSSWQRLRSTQTPAGLSWPRRARWHRTVRTKRQPAAAGASLWRVWAARGPGAALCAARCVPLPPIVWPWGAAAAPLLWHRLLPPACPAGAVCQMRQERRLLPALPRSPAAAAAAAAAAAGGGGGCQRRLPHPQAPATTAGLAPACRPALPCAAGRPPQLRRHPGPAGSWATLAASARGTAAALRQRAGQHTACARAGERSQALAAPPCPRTCMHVRAARTSAAPHPPAPALAPLTKWQRRQQQQHAPAQGVEHRPRSGSLCERARRPRELDAGAPQRAARRRQQLQHEREGGWGAREAGADQRAAEQQQLCVCVCVCVDGEGGAGWTRRQRAPGGTPQVRCQRAPGGTPRRDARHDAPLTHGGTRRQRAQQARGRDGSAGRRDCHRAPARVSQPAPARGAQQHAAKHSAVEQRHAGRGRAEAARRLRCAGRPRVCVCVCVCVRVCVCVCVCVRVCVCASVPAAGLPAWSAPIRRGKRAPTHSLTHSPTHSPRDPETTAP